MQQPDLEQPKTILEPGYDPRRRWLSISGFINDEAALLVAAGLMEMDGPDEPIKLLISSPGGFSHCGLGIYDALSGAKSPIHGYVMGYCQSAASLLLQAADRRYLGPSSNIMVHDGCLEIEDSIQNVKKWASYWDEQSTEMAIIYHRRMVEKDPKLKVSKVEKWLREGDQIYRGEEAVDIGLADEVWKSLPTGA